MIVVIVGPTGIGKTKLSLALAKHYDTELISGDSVQVYKKMDIGSAKVTKQEQQEVTHHLIDIYEPDKQFSVALYQKNVRKMISDFESQGKLPIIVGGTGLYIKSVLYDYNFDDAKRDPSLEKKYNDLDNQALHQLLIAKDPLQAEKIHPNNRKRVLQALSRSGKNKMSNHTNKDEKIYDSIVIGLTMERSKLYERINNRVDKMIEDGLIDEVKSLYSEGYSGYAMDAIGYKELFQYFAGNHSLEKAIELIKQHSRNLAKKQYTFFNNQMDVNWITVDPSDFEQVIETAKGLIDNYKGDIR
jgi:tRNA dimethylallyltransferase